MSGTIGGVNADIPLQAGQNALALQQRNNPLQMMEQFALTQNLLNQNRMFPGELALQKQQIQSGAQTLAQHIAQTGWQGMVPLLTGGPITHSRVTNQAGILEAEGYVTAPMLQAIADMPQGDGPAFDAAVRAQIAARAMTSPESAEAAVVGHPGMMSNGQFMQPGMIQGPGSQTPGAFTPEGMGVPQFPARSELAQPVHWTDSKGTPHQGTLAQYNQLVGTGALLGPAVPGGLPGAPAPAAPAGFGPVVGVNGPVSPQSPPRLSDVAPAPSGGGPIAGPAPGVVEAAQHSAAGNANQYLAFQQATNNLPQQKALLGNLEGEVKDFGSGPLANWKNLAEKYVNEVNPFGNIFSPATIATQEEFSKQAFQLAQHQFQALGGTGTDAKLDSTMHTSPSELLSQYGNEGIINILKGNVDALQAMRNEWQTKWLPEHRNDTGTWGSFVQQFNKHFDPRVFQAQYMNYPERQQMLHGMSKSEQASFKQDYIWAAENGWLPPPTALQPTAGAQ